MKSQIAREGFRIGEEVAQRFLLTVAVMLAVGFAAPKAQEGDTSARRQVYDQLLDANVRDGYVYYRALRADRGRLDGYIKSLASASLDAASRDEQIAFWLNAYNAIVLQTVVENYPIRQRTKDYPLGSIRQIPGAFERVTHRVGGRTITLDQIEQTVLTGFGDPRVFLALGRGAVGGGRLRSEAYIGPRLEAQLAEAANECLSHQQCVGIDRAENRVRVSSIFSWREKDFVPAYSDKAPAIFGERSPIERAVLAFVQPRLLGTEREFLEKNEFRVDYIPFDWSLNDLTGR